MASEATKPRRFRDRDLDRWSRLPHEEKLAEFSELVESHYWYFLPEELRNRIRRTILH